MPNYMLLLYATEAEREEAAQRADELPEWRERIEEMTAAGALVATGRLRDAHSATTVRRADGETELTDGPFAVTKEILGGYFLVDVPDLDEAVRLAARLPIARYGKVEVRPQMTAEEALRPSEGATAAG
jgi:hypothetical protein